MGLSRQKAAALLGVKEDISAEELKRHWKKIARDCHPDLYPDDAEREKKFRLLNNAYEILRTLKTSAVARDLADDVFNEEFDYWITNLPPEVQREIQRELDDIRRKQK